MKCSVFSDLVTRVLPATGEQSRQHNSELPQEYDKLYHKLLPEGTVYTILVQATVVKYKDSTVVTAMQMMHNRSRRFSALGSMLGPVGSVQ